MKIIFKKPVSRYEDAKSIGEVHLEGFYDTTACGIPDENWKTKETQKPLTCVTCKRWLEWAKEVSKIKN